MSALETLPNIGDVLADRLRASGIDSAEALLTLGDAAAFRRIRPLSRKTRVRTRGWRSPARCAACAGTASTRHCGQS